MILAFCLLIAEFRILASDGLPAATGSARGNWGLMFLLGLPLVILVAGTLQAISGIGIRDYFSVFAKKTLLGKIIVTTATVIFAAVAVVLVSMVG